MPKSRQKDIKKASVTFDETKNVEKSKSPVFKAAERGDANRLNIFNEIPNLYDLLSVKKHKRQGVK